MRNLLNYKGIWIRSLEVTLGLFCLLVITGLIYLPNASAHADRLVAGKYGFRVGLLEEPAYNGLTNGVDLSLCMGECKVLQDGSGNYSNPITISDVYETLQVEVVFGASRMPLKLAPVFRRPGKFSATFIPTEVGDYSLHFFGTIDKDKIDETFNPATDGFDSVEDIKTIQFPNKPGIDTISNPSASSTTSGSTVSSVGATNSNNLTTAPVTTQDIPTASVATQPAIANTQPASSDLEQQLALASQQVQAARQEVVEAKNSASAASTFAVIGIIIGLVGVIAAVLAILRSGRNSVEAG